MPESKICMLVTKPDWQLHAYSRNLKNRKYSIIFYHCKTNCNIVYRFLAAESFVVSFIQVFPVGKSKKYN